jgi:hypothetical protein
MSGSLTQTTPNNMATLIPLVLTMIFRDVSGRGAENMPQHVRWACLSSAPFYSHG